MNKLMNSEGKLRREGRWAFGAEEIFDLKNILKYNQPLSFV
jgi:hypothetical protein